MARTFRATDPGALCDVGAVTLVDFVSLVLIALMPAVWRRKVTATPDAIGGSRQELHGNPFPVGGPPARSSSST